MHQLFMSDVVRHKHEKFKKVLVLSHRYVMCYVLLSVLVLCSCHRFEVGVAHLKNFIVVTSTNQSTLHLDVSLMTVVGLLTCVATLSFFVV